MFAAIDTASLGILVLVVGFGSPAILAVVTGRQNRRAQQANWDRQDELEERQNVKLGVVKDALVQSTDATNGQLVAIHGLVNSNLTASMQSDLDQTKVSLVALERLLGESEPTVDELAAIKATKAKIGELEAQLQDRLTHAQAADDAVTP
jgi:hypothetical protein